MSPERSKRLLTGFLYAGGAVPVVTGIYAVLTGSGGMPGTSEATANVENELRFFASFWVGFGLAVLWVAPRVDRETTAVRALMGVLFLGGVARAIAWAAEGRPDAIFIVLMALELALPPLVVFWQSHLAAGQRTSP